MGGQWLCSFSFAHADTVYMPWRNGQDEIVYPVENNLDGGKVRLRFSNRYGSHEGRIAFVTIGDSEGREAPRVTCGGEKGFSVPPGQSILTDEIEMPVHAGECVRVRIKLRDTMKPESGYRLDDVSVGYLEELDVYSENAASVVAAFGDSITRMNTWTRPLQEKLYRQYPGKVSFSNKGISGNRLIHDCMKVHHNAFGVSGMTRFPYDVLGMPGLTHVIFALGTNDLGHPGEPDCPIEEQITPEDYSRAVSYMAEQLHGAGVKLYGTTITSRLINPPYWTGKKEMLRQKINEWIRSTNVFDEVFDYDAITRREDGSSGLASAYDSGDGLHLSVAGGAAIAASIPLELFEL